MDEHFQWWWMSTKMRFVSGSVANAMRRGVARQWTRMHARQRRREREQSEWVDIGGEA